MNIICVDDEPLALEMIINLCNRLDGNNIIHGFDDSQDAIDFVRDNPVNVAFLDIDMPGMTGLELAKELRNINNNLNVIMTTAYSEYSLDAFANDCSGYLLKPISYDALSHQMEVLRFPVEDTSSCNRVRFHCFGNFEVYIDDKPVHFKYQLSKEILAILVDRCGSLCSSSQISTILWHDEQHSEYYKKLRKDLLTTFLQAGCSDILNVHHGELGIDLSKVDCDYYDYLNNKADGPYKGEYMSQYSWATANLDSNNL